LGAVAELERSLIAERVRAGLRNARAKGKRVGRSRVAVDAAQIARQRAQGLSWPEIARELGCPSEQSIRPPSRAFHCAKIQRVDPRVSLKLQPQLVPKPLWRRSAASLLERTDWQRIRRDAIDTADGRCEICGSGGRLLCHEVWRYDDEQAAATLVGLEMHCVRCDLVTHMGRARAHGYSDAALDQLCRVNGILRADAEEVFAREMALWKKRNTVAWRILVDKTLLAKYPQLAILETVKGS
jgi:hypothetical protein